MSDVWLVLVPRDPYAAPDATALEAARAELERGLPDADDLVYDWPQAFARASLHARNPNVAELPPALQHEVERALGQTARVVWRRL